MCSNQLLVYVPKDHVKLANENAVALWQWQIRCVEDEDCSSPLVRVGRLDTDY
jgi:hypothetical protein